MGLNAVPDPLPGCRVVMDDVSWDDYENLLRDRGDGGTRMAYDRGTLEIRSPHRHERTKHLVARAIEVFVEERNIDIRSTGSMTFKDQRKERGIEPEESYYVQNGFRVRNREIDLAVDPPPDLAIETDLRWSRLDKFSLYAGLGFPEVWSYDSCQVIVHLLGPGGEFVQSVRSAAFSELPLDALNHHLKHPLKKRAHDPEEKALLADLHHHFERPDRGWIFEPSGRELLAEARRFIERLVSESETRFLIAFRELVRKNFRAR